MHSKQAIEGRLPCTMHSEQEIEWPHIPAITVFHVALRWTGAALVSPVLWVVFLVIGYQLTGHMPVSAARDDAADVIMAQILVLTIPVFFVLGQAGIWILRDFFPEMRFARVGIEVCRFLRALAAMLILSPFLFLLLLS